VDAVFVGNRGRVGATIAESAARDVELKENRRQRIVDLVGHARGEHPHGDHPVRHHELRLELPLIGHVDDGDQQSHSPGLRIENRTRGKRAPELGAVALSEEDVRHTALSGVEGHSVDRAACPFLPLHIDEVRERSADDLVAAATEHVLHPLVHVSRRSRLVEGPDSLLCGLDDRAIAGFTRAKRALRLMVPATDHGLTQLAIDDRNQPGQPALDEKIVSPCFERLDRDVLTDGSRDDDEWQVETALVKNLESLPGRKRGHRVVGDDEVPLLVAKRGAHRLCGFHTLPGEIVTGTHEGADEESLVVLRVLDEQKPELLHDDSSAEVPNGAASLRTSQ
jgi:hypothetical protein